MDIFLSHTTKAILLGVLAVGFGLNRLALVFPHVGWLQIFRLPKSQISDEQRARRQRSANRLAGLEMVIAGLILPLLYFGSTVLLFNEPKTGPMIIVGICSLICILVGAWIFARNL